MIGLSLLLSGSIRGSYINGTDLNTEYKTFTITKNNMFWDINNFKNAYNAMLSITIFPTILTSITGINSYLIINLILTICLSFIAPVIYQSFKDHKHMVIALFLGALFFIFQKTFISWSWIPLRQGIPFLRYLKE